VDILSLKPSTVTVILKHPGTGAPLGVSVECVSLESDQVKAVERQLKNSALRSGRNGMTAEKLDENTSAILAAAIVGWTWTGVTLGGDPRPPLTVTGSVSMMALVFTLTFTTS